MHFEIHWIVPLVNVMWCTTLFCEFHVRVFSVTGGNQRELARAKNLKKQQEMAKGQRKESGAKLEQRKQKYVLPKTVYRCKII